jgi:RNA polymerase sigma-70 factor (ECF subfamily)
MSGDRYVSGRSSARVVDVTRLVATYHRDLYGYAFRLCGSVNDAEDLVQQTFLIAHQKCHQIRSHHSARGWLYTVLRNCFLKDRRRRRPELAENIDVHLDQVGDEIPDALWVGPEQLQSAINELPDPFKLVLVMFYYEECSYRDIADRQLRTSCRHPALGQRFMSCVAACHNCLAAPTCKNLSKPADYGRSPGRNQTRPACWSHKRPASTARR